MFPKTPRFWTETRVIENFQVHQYCCFRRKMALKSPILRREEIWVLPRHRPHILLGHLAQRGFARCPRPHERNAPMSGTRRPLHPAAGFPMLLVRRLRNARAAVTAPVSLAVFLCPPVYRVCGGIQDPLGSWIGYTKLEGGEQYRQGKPNHNTFPFLRTRR